MFIDLFKLYRFSLAEILFLCVNLEFTPKFWTKLFLIGLSF